jgi:hypothetical protein
MIYEQERMRESIRQHREIKKNICKYIDYVTHADTESRVLYQSRNIEISLSDCKQLRVPDISNWAYEFKIEF